MEWRMPTPPISFLTAVYNTTRHLTLRQTLKFYSINFLLKPRNTNVSIVQSDEMVRGCISFSPKEHFSFDGLELSIPDASHVNLISNLIEQIFIISAGNSGAAVATVLPPATMLLRIYSITTVSSMVSAALASRRGRFPRKVFVSPLSASQYLMGFLSWIPSSQGMLSYDGEAFKLPLGR